MITIKQLFKYPDSTHGSDPRQRCWYSLMRGTPGSSNVLEMTHDISPNHYILRSSRCGKLDPARRHRMASSLYIRWAENWSGLLGWNCSCHLLRVLEMQHNPVLVHSFSVLHSIPVSLRTYCNCSLKALLYACMHVAVVIMGWMRVRIS